MVFLCQEERGEGEGGGCGGTGSGKKEHAGKWGGGVISVLGPTVNYLLILTASRSVYDQFCERDRTMDRAHKIAMANLVSSWKPKPVKFEENLHKLE